jgi:CheY-like chemotaxis protein
MSRHRATRILVIEDNGTNRALMVYLLKAFGYTTLEAVDGETGVERARRERPELIICDVHLPTLDGYGVVQELKNDQATRDIPIVAVTVLAMTGDRGRLLSAGFDGHISKPIVPATFVQEVANFLPAEQRTKIAHPGAAETAPKEESGPGI